MHGRSANRVRLNQDKSGATNGLCPDISVTAPVINVGHPRTADATPQKCRETSTTMPAATSKQEQDLPLVSFRKRARVPNEFCLLTRRRRLERLALILTGNFKEKKCSRVTLSEARPLPFLICCLSNLAAGNRIAQGGMSRAKEKSGEVIRTNNTLRSTASGKAGSSRT